MTGHAYEANGQRNHKRAVKLLHVLINAARGGCEYNCLRVCRELAAVEHEVLVIGSSSEMSSDFAAAGAKVNHLDLRSRSSFRAIKPVREHTRRVPPSGVILWHGLVELPQLLFALREHEIPIVVHGGNPAHTMPWWVDWKFRLLGRLLPVSRRPTYACCSRYVADSFETSTYLRRFPRLVIPNGVDPITGPAHEPRTIARDQPFTVGMVARLDEIKDHPTLLRAFARVARENPAARLELAGDGSRRPALEALTRDLGISDRVKLLGTVQDVYGAMRGWDVFAYATTDREGFGNALVEAMMFGLPCVATEIGPLREIAGTPAAIVLTPPLDSEALARALLKLVPNLDQRRQWSVAARERANREFSSKKCARRQAELLWPETAGH